jgi:hypothetical protein
MAIRRHDRLLPFLLLLLMSLLLLLSLLRYQVLLDLHQSMNDPFLRLQWQSG